MDVSRRVSEQSLMRPDLVVVIDISAYGLPGRVNGEVARVAVNLLLLERPIEPFLTGSVGLAVRPGEKAMPISRKNSLTSAAMFGEPGSVRSIGFSSLSSNPSLMNARATRFFTSRCVTVFTMPQAVMYREKRSRIVTT